MAAIKVAYILQHCLIEPIAGHGRPCWCPGRLLRLLHADLQPGSGSIVQVNDQALIDKTSSFLSSTSDFELLKDQEAID